VRIGLEILEDEQARIDAFCDDGVRERLLAGRFWRGLRDGRSSQSMLALLDEVHRCRRSGADLAVFAFDPVDWERPRERDAGMAERIVRACAAAPAAGVLVLAGDLHARRVRGEIPVWDADHEPAAALVARQRAVTSLFSTFRGGESWCITGEGELVGRPRPVRDRDQGDERRVIWYSQPDANGFSGELYLADVSASPPAVEP
jgi:hypothetical protein